MPLFGQLEVQTVLRHLPQMADFETAPWELPGAKQLYLAFEVGMADADLILPKAMHPAVPRYITVIVTRFPQTPVGPFTLAQVRLMGRAGVHPRGYTLHAYTNAAQATTELRQRWGFPAETADALYLRTHHDRIFATVEKAGRMLLDVALSHYEVVAGTDITFISSVHLAQVMAINAPGPRLVQVDPRYTIHQAERGRPVLNSMDAAAWNCPCFQVTNPMIGTFTTVDTDLPQIRFVMDPELPVTQGTTRVH
jgi:hypothetical protein